jgi:hypothetical protein
MGDFALVGRKPVLNKGTITLVGKSWGYILLVEVAPGAKLKPYIELWVPIR